MGTLKLQQRIHSSMVIRRLTNDGWAVTFGTATTAWASCSAVQSPPHCTKCNSPPINDQCTNFILFNVAL